MSKRGAYIEEFDDDTDLPLPNQPLPNTGARGHLLEEIDSDDDLDFTSPQAGPASPPAAKSQFRPHPADSEPSNRKNMVTDITPYKNWSCVYPIYIDAKRPYGTGQRRISRAKSVWWPLSKDMADAANRLGLGTLHEVMKSHPRDWENPGRVRILWKKDGHLMNPNIKTKKELLLALAFQIQILKPDNEPKPPYNLTASQSVDTPKPPPSSSSKGKQPANIKSKSPAVPNPKKSGGRRLPVPPEPLPALASRVSAYSPAISTGVLIETVKAGMSAQDSNAPGAPGVPGIPANMQKGKRKVVRVRG